MCTTLCAAEIVRLDTAPAPRSRSHRNGYAT
jgi:hypothetical protein